MNPHRDVMRYCWRHRYAAGRNRAARCPGKWYGKFVDVMVWRPDAGDPEAAVRFFDFGRENLRGEVG